jgi:hypothetical protein
MALSKCDTERHSFHSDQPLWAIGKTWTAALGAAKTGSRGPVAPRFSSADRAAKMMNNEEERRPGRGARNQDCQVAGEAGE